ncbi:conserved hypothetical protein [Brucella abortus bv. 4 str. 292]|uniref:Uncharacterized protein n=17 Tax=Brucella TaxID=234 RepID=Q2YK70_BRUA2|nr:hypothetical protein BMEII0855 [Brucella melitensis bv. 1 str. 16M]AAN33609.1 hypothetical protein BRA0413 [Brucella suis 1330]AAX76182.1 hypothetical protein BruAb2_0788 [Brucella abortus bv. 1 str. 9-941]ACU49543.1 hypothetical protein BMI_II410 [Brucella microti CCM 4915]AEK55841.1 hypothetical protein BPI_II395 [Brucella pinnipedialis B2/94]AEU07558.1 hypothetical protein BSVBI22_B0409 [Brucella suis VBI22]AHN48157.1 hypothetical protein BSS2_II0394 [Brucella suis bv. 1 str. S2]EEW900
MEQSKMRIYQLLHEAISLKGILKEPFKPKDLRRIVPGWPYAWYFSFLAQNCADNQPAGSAMFLRVGRGEYCLNQDADFAFDSARAATACGK